MIATMIKSGRKTMFPHVSDADWKDWKWQLRNRVETLEESKQYIDLTPEEEFLQVSFLHLNNIVQRKTLL